LIEMSPWIAGHTGSDYFVKLNGDEVWNGNMITAAGYVGDTRGVYIIPINLFHCSTTGKLIRFWQGPQLKNYLEKEVNDGSVIIGITIDDVKGLLNTGDANKILLQQFKVDVRDVEWRGGFAFVAQKRGEEAKMDKVATGSRKIKFNVDDTFNFTGIQSHVYELFVL